MLILDKDIRTLIASFCVAIVGLTFLDSLPTFKEAIYPGISLVYNVLGPKIAPNMVTLVVFDWRGYDTLGEALILVTAVVVVLLVFGRGKVNLKGD